MTINSTDLSHDEVMRLPPGFIHQIAEQCVQEVFAKYNRLPLKAAVPSVLKEANEALVHMGGKTCPLYFQAMPGLSPGEVVIAARNLYTELALLQIFIPPDVLESADPDKTFFSMQDGSGNHSVSLTELRLWFLAGTLHEVFS